MWFPRGWLVESVPRLVNLLRKIGKGPRSPTVATVRVVNTTTAQYLYHSPARGSNPDVFFNVNLPKYKKISAGDVLVHKFGSGLIFFELVT